MSGFNPLKGKTQNMPFDHEKCFPGITTIEDFNSIVSSINAPVTTLPADLHNYLEQWPDDEQFTLHVDVAVWVEPQTEQLVGVVRFSCPVFKTRKGCNFTSIDPDGMLDPETPPTVCLNLVEEDYVNMVENTIEPKLGQLINFYEDQLLGTWEIDEHRTERFTFTFKIGWRSYGKQGHEGAHRAFFVTVHSL